MSSEQSLKIDYDHVSYDETHQIIIQGVLSTFVNCGSQYAIWNQFPQTIRYTLKNLDSGVIYNSLDMELSISESGNDIYEYYAKKPCDRVVSKDFSVLLSDISFAGSQKEEIINFELQAEYVGQKSNVLTFKEASFHIRTL